MRNLCLLNTHCIPRPTDDMDDRWHFPLVTINTTYNLIGMTFFVKKKKIKIRKFFEMYEEVTYRKATGKTGAEVGRVWNTV
jgi:hypothetical protein